MFDNLIVANCVVTMSNGKGMENIDALEKLLQQNPHGVTITKCARKLRVHRTTIYKYLFSLDAREKAYYERGIAYPGKRSSQKEGKMGFWAYRRWKRHYEDEKRKIESLERKAGIEALKDAIMDVET